MLLRYFFVLAGATLTIAGVSLVWPKLTSRSRPETLGKVHELVLKTELGQKAAEILGVEDESTVVPINVASAAAQVAVSVLSSVQEKTQQVVVSQTISVLAKKYEELPTEQKKQFENLICKPQEQK